MFSSKDNAFNHGEPKRLLPSYLRGIRAQLIASSVGIFGLTLLLFSVFLYQVFTNSHLREFDADLLNYTVDIAYNIDVNLYGQITLNPKFMSQNEKLFPFELGETLIQIRDREGQVIARTKRLKNAVLPLTSDVLGQLHSGQSEFRSIGKREAKDLGLNAENYRLLSYYFEKQPGYAIILQVAAPTEGLEHERTALLTFFWIAIPLVLFVALLGGIYLSRKAVAPVRAMIDKTTQLSARKLSDRLPVPDTRDEIQLLALTLNGLFDRLEEAFRGQQTFVSDASHQLKTPLAILRGEIDLMRSRARTPEEIGSFLESAAEEVGYLTRMIEDLLVLARIDTGARSLSLSTVHIDETLVDVVARLNRIAAPKHVDLMVDFSGQENGAFAVQGDSDLIRSVFECIIENAIKYSRSQGGQVHIGLRETEGTVDVSIRDEGLGISREDLPKIFDRFFRSSQKQTHQTGGSGLGLSIAKRIIEVHQGSIRAESEPDRGTEVLISLRKKIEVQPLQP
jgi:signal transduction histidine kinase